MERRSRSPFQPSGRFLQNAPARELNVRCLSSAPARSVYRPQAGEGEGWQGPGSMKAVFPELGYDMIKDAAEDIVVEGDIQWTLKAMN